MYKKKFKKSLLNLKTILKFFYNKQKKIIAILDGDE